MKKINFCIKDSKFANYKIKVNIFKLKDKLV
jgi:hypothetical protein